MSTRPQAAFIAYVTLDAMAGDFHTQESALEILRIILQDRIKDYNPLVAYAPATVNMPDNSPRRKAFIIYVDLDEGGPIMNDRRAAQHAVRTILRDRLAPYSPVVSHAPVPAQPDNTIEGTIIA